MAKKTETAPTRSPRRLTHKEFVALCAVLANRNIPFETVAASVGMSPGGLVKLLWDGEVFSLASTLLCDGPPHEWPNYQDYIVTGPNTPPTAMLDYGRLRGPERWPAPTCEKVLRDVGYGLLFDRDKNAA